MAEYTYKDIIIDPTSEEAKNAVGKKCFVGNIPTSCLEHANENDYDFLTKLNSINLNLENPFNVKFNGVEHNFNSIIVKKEDPKKYVPFETLDEFIESYKKAEERITYSNTRDYIASCGMWLKDTDRDVYCLVTEIWNYGVVVGDSKMKTTNEGDDEYFTINEVTTWEQFLMLHTFLDGSPCGKLAGEGQ